MIPQTFKNEVRILPIMSLPNKNYLFAIEKVHPHFQPKVWLALYEYKEELYPMADGWREILNTSSTCPLSGGESTRDILEDKITTIIKSHKSNYLKCSVPLNLNPLEIGNLILPNSATEFITIYRGFTELEEKYLNSFLNKEGYSLEGGKLEEIMVKP